MGEFHRDSKACQPLCLSKGAYRDWLIFRAGESGPD